MAAKRTDQEIIESLLKHLEKKSLASPGDPTGACIITSSTIPTCASITQSDCISIGGVWVGGPCPRFISPAIVCMPRVPSACRQLS
jgi:hypothetical protein